MSAAYLPFEPAPCVPRFTLPVGAVDCHCHVFGPANRFPYALTRRYTPTDAPKATLFALRDHLGLTRNIIVQASCHGSNNEALLDALATAGELARGVAVIAPDVTDNELVRLDQAGIRAIRFNFVKRLGTPPPLDVLMTLANRIAPLRWHIVVYLEPGGISDLVPFLRALPTPVVIDHMGTPDVARGVNDQGFQDVIDLLASSDTFWTKLSCPERLSISGPGKIKGHHSGNSGDGGGSGYGDQSGDRSDYDDVVPFAQALQQRFYNRVLWGSDWPHPNMRTHMPDDGRLVDFIPRITSDLSAQRALLIDNPMRLYWPETVAGT